jgi:hypothetical protein
MEIAKISSVDVPPVKPVFLGLMQCMSFTDARKHHGQGSVFGNLSHVSHAATNEF